MKVRETTKNGMGTTCKEEGMIISSMVRMIGLEERILDYH